MFFFFFFFDKFVCFVVTKNSTLLIEPLRMCLLSSLLSYVPVIQLVSLGFADSVVSAHSFDVCVFIVFCCFWVVCGLSYLAISVVFFFPLFRWSLHLFVGLFVLFFFFFLLFRWAFSLWCFVRLSQTYIFVGRLVLVAREFYACGLSSFGQCA